MPSAKEKSEHVQAKEAASGSVDGVAFVLKPGEILRADDPIAKKYPGFFKELEPQRRRPVIENATAAPGERRGEL